MATERSRLPTTVILLGLTSFFADVASEMIFPLLPLFLTTVIGASPAFLGLIEGAADAVASVLKLISGRLSDTLGRKPLVVFGYGIAGVARPLVALATAPWHVLAIRISDRLGKGTRSSPRDALIADAAGPENAGRAFGFHRAFDHAGAVVGPLVAAALLGLGFGLRSVFWIAAIPSLLSLVVVLMVREAHQANPSQKVEKPEAGSSETLPSSFKAYLGVLLLFSLGNSSDAFLLLRAKELGVSDAAIPILWAFFHVFKLGSSYFGGSLSDRFSRTSLIVVGWIVYALAYFGFGLAQSSWQIWALFGVYGLYYGLTEPAEKALVRDLVPASQRGRAFGYYNFIVGISAFPASLLMGGLWSAFGPFVALAVGAGLSGAAATLLLAWRAKYGAKNARR